MHQDLKACCPMIIEDERARVNSAPDRIAGVVWPQSKKPGVVWPASEHRARCDRCRGHPSDPGRYLMARAVVPGLVTAEDIMEFDLGSNPVDRRGRSLFVERFIHGEACKSRPDVNAAIHTHSAGVIPFSVMPTPLRPVIHNASFLHVGVPVREIRDAGGATDMLVRDGKLGQSLAAALGNKPVALMRGHGNVVVGPNVRVATARAIFTDENARMQAVAISLGGPVNYISSAEGALRDRDPSDPARAWDLWKANVMKKPQ